MRKHLLPSACLPLSAAGSSVLVQSWQLNTAIELMHAVCFLFVCERARERERETEEEVDGDGERNMAVFEQAGPQWAPRSG